MDTGANLASRQIISKKKYFQCKVAYVDERNIKNTNTRQ